MQVLLQLQHHEVAVLRILQWSCDQVTEGHGFPPLKHAAQCRERFKEEEEETLHLF